MNTNNRFYVRVPFRQKPALIISGVLIAILLLEAGLRLGGFVILSLQEHGNMISIRQRGECRILCLGESTTQNQYPRFLEAILNQKALGVRSSVIDKGRMGINTDFILSQLESNLDKYRPDIVVTMMGINDYGNHMPYEAPSHSGIMFFLRSFKTYKLGRLLWLHLSMQFAPAKQTHTLSSGNSFKKAVELNPKNDQAYVGLGWSYQQQGNFPRAEDSFKKAVELNPKNDQAYVGLGWSYQQQGKFREAEEIFKKAVELNPKNDQAYVGLGWSYQQQGKFRQSEELSKRIVKLNPKNDQAYVGLALSYQQQGKFREAEEIFKKAIELNPKNDQVYLELGWLYQQQGKFREAEELFKRAIRLNSEVGKLYRLYGALLIVYGEMGKHELAEEYYKKTNELRLKNCFSVTVNNYRKLKETLDKRGIQLVCVQYPMVSIEPLKSMFAGQQGVIFIDNERIFKEAVKKDGYKAYFTDMFAGDFGHCTIKGNRLLAENIADTILEEVFHK